MKLKLHRDKVISVARGKDLVGVYVKLELDRIIGTEICDVLLAGFSPEKADAIIKLWNSK